MGPLEKISNGLGKFVHKMVERSECLAKNSEATECAESSEIVESADSFKVAEVSASSTQNELVKDSELPSAVQETTERVAPDESAEKVDCASPEPIRPTDSDKVMQLTDFIEMVAPSKGTDPVILKIAESAETMNSVEVADTINCLKNSIDKQNDVSESGMLWFPCRYCQTEDQPSESTLMKSETFFSELIGKHADLIGKTDTSQRPNIAEAAVQTEADTELSPVQAARTSKETSPANSPKMIASADSPKTVASESVTSSVARESGDSFATADSSGTVASPNCAERIESPTSSESWTSVQSATTMVPLAPSPESSSAEATGKENHLAFVAEGNSTKVVAENCVEKDGKQYTELTPLENPAQKVNNSIASWTKEIAAANFESYLQITGVELSSTSFILENNNSLPNDEEGDFEDLRNYFNDHAQAITFDGACDVTSTNAVENSINALNNQQFTYSIPDVTELLRELGEGFPPQPEESKMQCIEPMTEPCKEAVAEPSKEPAVVQPNYPAVVATSPDSTGDGYQSRLQPCSLVIPRMEIKFPQYAHLVRRAIKRKQNLPDDSALKKKLRQDIVPKTPLGSCKPRDSQPVSQRLEKKERSGKDLSLTRSKPLKSKKGRPSREPLESKSVKKSKPPEYVSKFISPPKADLNGYRIPKKLPKMKITTKEINDRKKENIPKRPEVSKRKISDSSDDRGSPLCPKNLRVERDSGLKHVHCMKNREPSSKHRPIVRRRISSDSSSGSEKESNVLRQNEKLSNVVKPLETTSTSRDVDICEDVTEFDPLVLPGMPELSPWEPMDFDVAKSQQQTTEKTSMTASVENNKIFHVHDIPKIVNQVVNQVVTFMNSPDRRENLADPVRSGTSKSVLKKKRIGLSSNPKVEFGVNHSFRIIDCDDSMWYPFHCLLPEKHIQAEIYERYSLEIKKAKLSSLKWVHRCHHSESRPIRSTVLEPKFNCSDYIDKLDKSTFEEHIRDLIQSRLHKVIVETEYRPETTNEIDFVIDVFDTSEKECWKIILKRKTNSNETTTFKVGDVVSLTLFTKYRKLDGKWKKTIIFGYTEETGIKVKGNYQIQHISLSIHPIPHEVNRDQEAKIQTVVNIGQHLRLSTASAVFPYSEVADLFTILSSKESKSVASSADNMLSEFSESEQALAVNSCYEGIRAEDPFMYFVDGPPGTGKTNFIVKLVQKLCPEEQLNYFLKILIVTHTNASGDEILRRLVNAQNQSHTRFNILRFGDVKTIHPSLKKYTLDDSNYTLQQQSLSFDIDLEKRICEAQKNGQKKIPTSEMNEAAETNALRRRYIEDVVVGSADVVIVSQDACYQEEFLKNFTPCASKDGIFNKFTVCIFDDANEMSEIDLLVPVMTMSSNLILIGDSKNPTNDEASLTPFCQLLQKYQKTVLKNTISFTTQYRLLPKMIDCLKKIELLIMTKCDTNAESKSTLKPLMVIDLPSEDESLDDAKDFEAQAKICRTIVQYFLKLKEFNDLRTGIVVGKKKQRDIVRAELKYCSSETMVEKVDAYCGLEKDMIIACMPSLLYPRKFLYNALTRARHSVICGDFSRYKGQETIEKLVEYAVRRKCYIRWDKDPSDFPVRTLRLFLSKNNDVTSS